MRNIFIVLCILVLGMTTSHAQEKLFYDFDATPLKVVIQQLEKDLNLHFSYAEDVVASKQITLQVDGLLLTELLSVLEAQTALHFEKLEGQDQVIIAPIAFSGNISLFLLDQETRMPLVENQVMVDSILLLETNQKGFLQFEDDGLPTHHLDVSGYGSFDFASSKNITSIYLSPQYKQLREVVVTSYITTGIDRNRDGSITLTQRPLGPIPGQTTPDILQSIQMIPGVTSLDESASGIQIHGGTSDQNLVLFDHIRVFNTGYLFGMLSRFNPYATEKADIFKTATSAVYGDRVSGVINISTDEKVASQLSGGFGVDGLSVDGFIKLPLSKKSSVSLFARNSYLDVFESPTYEAYERKIFNNSGTITDSNGNPLNVNTDDDYTYENSQNEFRFYDLNAKFVYQPSAKDKISISALMTRNRTNFSFMSEGETKVDSLTTGNGGVSVNWIHHTSPTQTEEVTTYFSSYDSYYLNEEFYSSTLEETNIRGNRISDFGLDLKSDRILGNGDRFTFGYQLSNTNLEVDLSSVSSGELENNLSLPVHESNFKNVLFGEYSFIKQNTGILKIGLRTVHYGSLARVYLEPRLNMELAFSKSLRLRAGLERRNQPISQLIEFNQTELRLENNLWRLSDDVNFPLLQSKQISTGLLFDKKGWTLDAEAYYKRVAGLTTYSQGFTLPEPNLSEGKSRILGMDFLIKKRIDRYRFWIGYSFNDVNFTFNEIQEGSFSGNNDITHSFRISSSLQLNNFQFSLGWQYRTGVPVTLIENYDEDTRRVNFGPLNAGRLPDFHRLDASVVHEFDLNQKNSRMQIGLSALNLYNRVVPLSIIHRTSQQNGELLLDQVVYRRSLGFTPNITFRLFF